MLSRVANSLFWMSRYIERAENTARIVDVNLQLLLDFRKLDDRRLVEHWVPIVQSTGDDKIFFELYPVANGQTVTEFMVFRQENANSIMSAVAQARENARMVRDQITAEMWEEINRLYLFLRSRQARQTWASAPDEFCNEVKRSSIYLQGLVRGTLLENEGWHFMEAGRAIERADKTTRILDVRHQTLPERGMPGPITETEALEWVAVLRSCSAIDGYRQTYGADVQPARIAELLVLSDEFPRSVRSCVAQLDRALRSIAGTPSHRFTNTAEKLSGRLLAELQFSTAEDIFAPGLHEYLDQVQIKLNAVGDSLFQAYIFLPYLDTEPAVERQQQQQQQQQQQVQEQP
ncbi:MAG: alpha-E domain-containing protein [Verrucomicrobiales bacterium]|nr:alpha-E domain-containing protein [Verrucomicrobiales bacterium]